MEDEKVDDRFGENSFLDEQKEKSEDRSEGKGEDGDGGAESLSESISPSKRPGRRSRRQDIEKEEGNFDNAISNSGGGGGAWGQEDNSNRTESEAFSLSYERMNRRGQDVGYAEEADNDESNQSIRK